MTDLGHVAHGVALHSALLDYAAARLAEALDPDVTTVPAAEATDLRATATTAETASAA